LVVKTPRLRTTTAAASNGDGQVKMPRVGDDVKKGKERLKRERKIGVDGKAIERQGQRQPLEPTCMGGYGHRTR
jgi:hypothetical protein